MHQSKYLLLGLTTSTLLLLNACGGGGSSSGGDTPISNNTSSIVPTTINITLPNGLKSTRSTTSQKATFQKTSDTIPSLGYEQLKSTIKEAEGAIKEVKGNLVLLGGMMSDIEIACEGTVVNTQCTIPANTITLTIDNALKSELDKINSEFNDVEDNGGLPPLNTVLTMGEVLYTQFDNNHTYQYDVVLDLEPTFTTLGETVTKHLETMRWSDDNNSVETVSDVNDNYGTFNMHLTYHKQSDGSSRMNITDEFKDKAPSTLSGTFALAVKELKDTNNTVKVTSSGTFSEGVTNNQFDIAGQISDKGGFLSSKGTLLDGNSNFAEKETFNSNGDLLQSKFCDEIGCDTNDETTWHTFDEVLGLNNNGFNDDEFTANLEEIPSLVINGGNLELGRYELLPQNLDLVNGDVFERVRDNEIAFIDVFLDDSNQKTVVGILNQDNYTKDMDLSQVDLYKVEYGAYGEPTVYSKITGENRPHLSVEFL